MSSRVWSRSTAFALALFFVVAIPSLARGQDPRRATDIVLGFFDKKLDDGERHDLVDELEQSAGGIDYFKWDQMGFPEVEEGTWNEARVLGAMQLAVDTDHRIRFNVTGFSFGQGSKDPLAVDPGADAGDVGYTAWELAQVRTHRAFWDATDFYLRQKDGGYAKLSRSQLAKLGLSYQGPALEAIGKLKGRLLRESPTESVFTVRGEPGEELVVVHDPRGATESARDALRENTKDEQDALDALAKLGVRVARRSVTGTVSGELAFVRDALAPGAPTTVASGKTTLELSRSTSGALVVSGIRSPGPRLDKRIDAAFAADAKAALIRVGLATSQGAGDARFAKYLTPDALSSSTPQDKRKLTKALVDYLALDEGRGASIARAIAQGSLELVTEGEAAAGQVLVDLESGLPFSTLAALLVRDATAELAPGELTAELKAECLAAAFGFARRMRIPIELVNDRFKLALGEANDIASAILEKVGLARSPARDAIAARITSTLAEAQLTPDVLAKIKDRDAASRDAPSPGFTRALDERLATDRDR